MQQKKAAIIAIKPHLENLLTTNPDILNFIDILPKGNNIIFRQSRIPAAVRQQYTRLYRQAIIPKQIQNRIKTQDLNRLRLLKQLQHIKKYILGQIIDLNYLTERKNIIDYLTKSNLPIEFRDNTIDFLLPYNLPFDTATKKQLFCVLKVLHKNFLKKKRLILELKPFLENLLASNPHLLPNHFQLDTATREQLLSVLRGVLKAKPIIRPTDLFGNAIVDPVIGDDDIIYDRSSMKEYFRKDIDDTYINIPYIWMDEAVPWFRKRGGKKRLTTYQEL
jgi:hypothetical protein